MKSGKRRIAILENDVQGFSRLNKSMVLDNVGVLQYISFGPRIVKVALSLTSKFFNRSISSY